MKAKEIYLTSVLGASQKTCLYLDVRILNMILLFLLDSKVVRLCYWSVVAKFHSSPPVMVNYGGVLWLGCVVVKLFPEGSSFIKVRNASSQSVYHSNLKDLVCYRNWYDLLPIHKNLNSSFRRLNKISRCTENCSGE